MSEEKMCEERLIRVLEFLGFARATVNKLVDKEGETEAERRDRMFMSQHEKGRGNPIFVVARPEYAWQWNTENGVIAAYDAQGCPWVRWHPSYNVLNLSVIIPGMFHNQNAYVPRAYDTEWMKETMGTKPYIYHANSETALFVATNPATTKTIMAAIRAKKAGNPKRVAEIFLLEFLLHTCPGRPISDEELKVFENYDQEFPTDRPPEEAKKADCVNWEFYRENQ